MLRSLRISEGDMGDPDTGGQWRRALQIWTISRLVVTALTLRHHTCVQECPPPGVCGIKTVKISTEVEFSDLPLPTPQPGIAYPISAVTPGGGWRHNQNTIIKCFQMSIKLSSEKKQNQSVNNFICSVTKAWRSLLFNPAFYINLMRLAGYIHLT